MENNQQQSNSLQPDSLIQKQKQKDHSLSADLAMGWRPKLKVIGPIPLNFDNQFIDKAIKDLLKSQASIYSVIYLGPRPSNTFKMHQIIKKKYKYKYQHLFAVQYGNLKAFFHKFYSEFQPKMKMPFLGMNPTYKSHKITFDSCFQSGNLDCVVKVSQNQYDLILRVDSNTAGHIMWYYFKTTSNQNASQTVKFNIINLRRNKSCYQRGMKPFIRRKKRNQNNSNFQEIWTQWEQGGINVQVQQEKIRFAKQNFVFNPNGLVGIEEPPVLFRRLTFQIQFEPFQQIQLAYCIPYTYSDLTNDIKLLKQTITEQNTKNIYFQLDTNNQSLSGLQIPILKITQKQQQKYDQETQKNKFCVFIIGRQHPGQSNGSFVMRGILQQLITNSPQMMFLRRHIVFKIVPMLNVDGVVLGNFRTSLYGKDLNRLFKKQQLFLIPEVQTCKEEFNNLIKIHKNKVMLFLDIHGHSARRNAFCYGPGILDSNAFSDVRQFAKIIASNTQIFRYPSCSFRIDQDKQTTARACFSKAVGLAYTIESSNWSFYSRSQGKMINFTRNQWEQIGSCLIQSLYQYAEQKIMKKISKKKKNKNKDNKVQGKINQKKYGNQIEGSKSLYNNNQFTQKQSPKKIDKAQAASSTQSTKKNYKNRESVSRGKINKNQSYENNSQTQNDADKQSQLRNHHAKIILKRQTNYLMNEIEEADNQSDKMGDNEMDSDSEGQDMQKSKFQKYMNGAKKMMIQFQKVYLGDDYQRKGRTALKLRNEAKKLMKDNSNKNMKKVQILACLRKKQPNSQVDVNSNRMIDIAGKIKLQPRKISTNNNTIPLNTKIIQFETQHDQEAKQIILINQKVPYQKFILPRIEQSYQVKRKHDFLEKGIPQQKISRIQEWSQYNQTPQLLNNDDQRQRYEQDALDIYKARQNIRQKSITNYQKRSLQRLIDISPSRKNQFQTVESKNLQDQNDSSSYQSQNTIEEQINKEQQIRIRRWNDNDDIKRWSGGRNLNNESEISSIRQIKQSLRYNILHNNIEKQPQQIVDQQSNLFNAYSISGRGQQHKREIQSPNKNIRFSMKPQLNQLAIKSSIIKNPKQNNHFKKLQLIQKLSDPSSLNYKDSSSLNYKHTRNQIISSQDLGGINDRKNLVNFQFHNFNYSKQQFTQNQNNTQSNKNHQKIQQIILNNLQLMKGNPNKINSKHKKQKQKQKIKQIINSEEQKQKFSIDIVPHNQNKTSKISPQKIQIKKNSLNINSNKQFIHVIGQSQSNYHQQPQNLISSVVLLRNNLTQLEKIKTLQSQNLPKNAITSPKKAAHKQSATRNFSDRQPDKQFELLREQQNINRKVMRFGGQSLPRIGSDKKQKIKSPHQYSKTKIGINRQIQKIQKQSPRKNYKAINNSISPQTDYTNIKLVCINERVIQGEDKKQKQMNNNKSNNNNKQVGFEKNVKQNNKQRLLDRLSKLQRQQRQKFGEQNLIINKQLLEKSNRNGDYVKREQMYRQGQQIKAKQLGINNEQNKRMKTNESSGPVKQLQRVNNKQRQISKQIKIFALPTGVNINKSTYFK